MKLNPWVLAVASLGAGYAVAASSASKATLASVDEGQDGFYGKADLKFQSFTLTDGNRCVVLSVQQKGVVAMSCEFPSLERLQK